MRWANDPENVGRMGDNQVAWSIKDYLINADNDPRRLILLPMAKAGLLQMQAAQEFIKQKNFGDLSAGWMVMGASKRGWTTYLIGAVAPSCESCVKVIGLLPMVPIMPDLHLDLHRQWRAYNGFSFAFKDYLDTDLIKHLNLEKSREALKMIDPLSFKENIAQIPKHVTLASSDEFMMMDWTNIWYDKVPGEFHVNIVPDAEHGLVTNLRGVLSPMSAMMKSIASGKTERPTFNYTINNETGELIVYIDPKKYNIKSVYLRHSETHSTTRRDFRFLRQANDFSEACSFPEITIPSLDGANCLSPVYWSGKKLNEAKEGTGCYKVMPPKPSEGHWSGYYIQMYFAGDTNMGSILLFNEFSMTTPGFTWPNTLPFPDCEGEQCI